MEINLNFKDLEGSLDFLVDQLAGVPGIQRIDFQPPTPPDPNTKVIQAVSGLIVKLVPDAVEAVLAAAAKATARLTATPTEITVTAGPDTNAVSVKFDPRYATSERIAEAADLITRSLKATRRAATRR